MLRRARTAAALMLGALPLTTHAAAGSSAQPSYASAPTHAAAHRARIPARTARVIGVRDEGSLGFMADSATQIVDEGHVSGTIPGKARVDFAYNGSPIVTARFVIRAAGGSLYGQATCRLSNPTSPTPSFRGALSIAGGSGRYAHARGAGELFGVFHRRGYALVVQAIGRLRY